MLGLSLPDVIDGSGQFCGMARMMSPVDYTTSSSVWTQTDKWKGRMDVRWIFVKDIPNAQLRHIRVWNNENKPVTNSRDTQELPPDAGLAMLRILADYPPKTSVILSNLVAAEMKETTEEQELQHRQSWQSHQSHETSARNSYQPEERRFDVNRRNTIGTIGQLTSTRGVVSTTPTSGMRSSQEYYVAPPRHHDPSSYRTMLSGFASVGDQYTTQRYPPFHERHHYEDELRYF